MHGYFSREDLHLVNRHTRICLNKTNRWRNANLNHNEIPRTLTRVAMKTKMCWQECGEIWTLLVGQNDSTAVENSLAVPQKKFNVELPYATVGLLAIPAEELQARTYLQRQLHSQDYSSHTHQAWHNTACLPEARNTRERASTQVWGHTRQQKEQQQALTFPKCITSKRQEGGLFIAWRLKEGGKMQLPVSWAGKRALDELWWEGCVAPGAVRWLVVMGTQSVNAIRAMALHTSTGQVPHCTLQKHG